MLEQPAGPQPGYVYILSSPNIDSLKIGGSRDVPFRRLRELNTTDPYRRFGPWSIEDYREVTNWRDVEGQIHYAFRSRLTVEPNTRELFGVSLAEARMQLETASVGKIKDEQKIDRLFLDPKFLDYLIALYRAAGFHYLLDTQGVWTLSLFPSTNGGRFYTLNIGSYEVAYSPIRAGSEVPHMVLMYRSVLDSKDFSDWRKRAGSKVRVERSPYLNAKNDAVSVYVNGGFELLTEMISLRSVRMAIFAYWGVEIDELAQQDKASPYARYHAANAIIELKKRLEASST